MTDADLKRVAVAARALADAIDAAFTRDLLGDRPELLPRPAKVEALPCPYVAIVDAYHEILPMGVQCMKLTDARLATIRARWAEYRTLKKWTEQEQGLQFFREFFGHVSRSKFLTGQVTGQSGRPFAVSLPWLMMAEHFAKVIEGSYHGR